MVLVSTRVPGAAAALRDRRRRDRGTRKKDSYLATQYQRLRGRRGPAKALTAVGHSILTAVWHMLKTGELYRDLGNDYFVRQDPDRVTRRLVRRLEALGHTVLLKGPEVAT